MDKTFDRRRFLQAGAALAAVSALPVSAQESRPLKIIVPLPAGGVADNSVRFFAEPWTALTRQQVVVDNRPGGSFVIGMQQIASAPPDGNTWIHLNSGMSAAQATFGKYDMLKQVTPIGMIGSTPGTIFVNANSPINTSKDLVDWIRANPGKLNYGAITGGIEHLLAVSMLRRNGLTGTMVAFKGGPDACTALAQNEIQMVISALPLIIPFKGKIKPIVMLTEQRSPLTPEVSTFREQGLDINELNYWGAFAVPAGTPASIVAQHHRNLAEVVKTPALASKYMTAGMFAQSSTSEVMAKIIAEEVRWMTPIANELKLKAG